MRQLGFEIVRRALADIELEVGIVAVKRTTTQGSR